mmetsp:Transcript_12833/g.18467  ORF Transcript_12833/g.18467 Transcript_12833/m.18467 type:complete len:191 (-) Transcript_12833:39-611(-)|eukprot:CAMPEP_0202458950 /NCGR_PEP_ID=MMETSP1360-20130828/28699_1 /ASSEMBLY_ACC=CAM_ASM_000848 /TAXON_ID=515479 /ORGANISM="Licmophora paradoxa, Strain CCMP2313" /LENGTH=190 /DNA_ID=CAMNT_0049079719 /DNA_START=46 /DNA_END=618 /DNA_ORIENTATION=-
MKIVFDREEATESIRKGLIQIGAKLDNIQIGINNKKNKKKNNNKNNLESVTKIESINQEIVELQERKAIVRETEAACLETVLTHLREFTQIHPKSTYEEWISQLHPENVKDYKPTAETNTDCCGIDTTTTDPSSLIIIDHRFYVTESDHRRMWNANLDGTRNFVYPRDQMYSNMQQQTNLCCLGLTQGVI